MAERVARAYARTAALMASAVCHLSAYQLSERLWGPSPARALRILRHWSRKACAWLRVDIRVHGQPALGSCVYVSNHRSYLDIPVLASVLGPSFMSRADIATWPVVGAAARAVGVVLVDRDSLNGRVRAARYLARRVKTANVVVFPEGTTRGERLPGPFHSGLFRLLHRLGTTVVPVTIRYSDRRAYWVDDITMSQHLRRQVFNGHRLKGEVHIGQPLVPSEHSDAENFARAVHQTVCGPIEEFGEVVDSSRFRAR
jgi:lyso-ornithine lipid O-acyltransferase